MTDPLDALKAYPLERLIPADALKGRQGLCFCGGRSFTHYPRNNSWACFSCGTGGSTIDYVMHSEGVPLREAIRILADRAGIALEPPTPEVLARITSEKRKERALDAAARFYHTRLLADPEALAYWSNRGFTPETIADLRLGLANGKLLAMIRSPGAKKRLVELDLTEADFVGAGILSEDGREYHAGRLTIPTIIRGRVVTITGRARGDAQPKYKNMRGPQEHLWGEDAIQSGKDVHVLEGLPDAITAYQLGLNAVGVLGTSGLGKHADKFARARRVFLCFDTDEAGRRGAIKAAIDIQKVTVGEVRLVALPNVVKDLNEWVCAGGTREEVEALCHAAPHILDVLLESVPTSTDHDTLLAEIASVIAPMGAVAAERWVQATRNAFGLRIAVVQQAVAAARGTPEPSKPAPEPTGETGMLDIRPPDQIIPAQQYLFGQEVLGRIATYAPWGRVVHLKDGTKIRSEEVEPVVVTVRHAGGVRTVDITAKQDMDLDARARARFPSPIGVDDRWHSESRYPHGQLAFRSGATADAGALFGGILGLLKRHIWLPDERDLEAVAVWVMGTYVFDLFDAYPYLHFYGVRESGKTDLMRLIEGLAFNAVRASYSSPSLIYRSAHANRRTFLIEEAEQLSDPTPGTAAESIALLVNDGYKRGAKAEVSGPDPKNKGDWVPQSFDIYSPKALASIAPLHFVLGSRCIIVPCSRAHAADLDAAGITDLSSNGEAAVRDQGLLRDHCYVWALSHFPEVRAMFNATKTSAAVAHLRGRERELWLPLLALARHVDKARGGGALAERFLALQQVKAATRRSLEADASIEVVTLKAIYEAIAEPTIGPIRNDLVFGPLYVLADLAALVSVQLVEVGIINADRPLNGRRLAEILSKTGVAGASNRTDVKIEGSRKRCIGISDTLLRDAIRRLGDEPAPSNMT